MTFAFSLRTTFNRRPSDYQSVASPSSLLTAISPPCNRNAEQISMLIKRFNFLMLDLKENEMDHYHKIHYILMFSKFETNLQLLHSNAM